MQGRLRHLRRRSDIVAHSGVRTAHEAIGAQVIMRWAAGKGGTEHPFESTNIRLG